MNRSLTRSQFNAIKKHFDVNITNFASEGPWDYNKDIKIIVDKNNTHICKLNSFTPDSINDANADIIMLSRMLIPLLLTTIENGLEEE